MLPVVWTGAPVCPEGPKAWLLVDQISALCGCLSFPHSVVAGFPEETSQVRKNMNCWYILRLRYEHSMVSVSPHSIVQNRSQDHPDSRRGDYLRIWKQEALRTTGITVYHTEMTQRGGRHCQGAGGNFGGRDMYFCIDCGDGFTGDTCIQLIKLYPLILYNLSYTHYTSIKLFLNREPSTYRMEEYFGKLGHIH